MGVRPRQNAAVNLGVIVQAIAVFLHPTAAIGQPLARDAHVANGRVELAASADFNICASQIRTQQADCQHSAHCLRRLLPAGELGGDDYELGR